MSTERDSPEQPPQEEHISLHREGNRSLTHLLSHRTRLTDTARKPRWTLGSRGRDDCAEPQQSTGEWGFHLRPPESLPLTRWGHGDPEDLVLHADPAEEPKCTQ